MYEQIKVTSWFLKLSYNSYVNLISIMTYENVNLISILIKMKTILKES